MALGVVELIVEAVGKEPALKALLVLIYAWVRDTGERPGSRNGLGQPHG